MLCLLRWFRCGGFGCLEFDATRGLTHHHDAVVVEPLHIFVECNGLDRYF